MNTKTYPGLWCDVALDPVSGLALLIYQRPDTTIVCVDERGFERWSVEVGLEWHQLRAAINAAGDVLVCATGHDDRLWWLVSGGPARTDGQVAFGQNATVCRAVSLLRWEIGTMRSPTAYDLTSLHPDGAPSSVSELITCPHTSQGFLGVNHSGPVMMEGNRYYTDPRTSQVLHCPSRVGEIVVGQDGPSNHVLAAHPDRLYRVWPADGFEARAVSRPVGGYAVCVRALRQTVALVIVEPPYPADEWNAAPAPAPNPNPAPIPVPVETPTMTFTQIEKDLLVAFAAAFPPPQSAGADLASVADWEANRRVWTRKLAQTFKARLGGWGTKKADQNRPQSKDALAKEEGGRLWGFDTCVATSDTTIALNPDAHGEDITGQVFIPVEGRDWLAGIVPGPALPPVTPPGPVTPPVPQQPTEPADPNPIGEIIGLSARVAQLEATVGRLVAWTRGV